MRLPERDRLMAFLAERGIETLVHYPVPLSAQQAFARYDPHACPVASLAAAELLSLPLNPRMSREDVIRVADTVNEFSERRGNA